ncbi:hypothetical protein [Brevibacillus antibioticus]|uniref:hypothetical protein n=1 Tax=Brevibacillus antibioticus TaxID=2570228 RepID=UPI001FCBA65D|nr:hypothetical protein [Brevibacillus antibioticus]
MFCLLSEKPEHPLQLLLADVQKVLDKEQLSHHASYTLAKGKDGKVTATEGCTETRIGRNALGLKNTLTFLVETRASVLDAPILNDVYTVRP